ncbi:MAG: 8-oxoguanine deaminase, partial [Anaerolineales bacterium]|nr:8-oxoguanine deaminase [Anaerolineales bacterium]
MSNLILNNIGLVVTMDDERSELSNVNIVIRDGIIDKIGVSSDQTQITGVPTVDMSGYAVFPGLINTHHHLYQTLTRAIPGAQNSGLF